ncbi:hypothetical protein SBOR_6369 [Sclerotinia borealis F-4128]|uniref:Uncharacterized protein n=1 Tax=Sclerotinia borealis (strain F-4128) TaxID=1432307 RepID=W9CEQ3_SCLBF|nr:hypothetical protein SBOR_6369 [Sclerotinia borealis F-4128]
MMQYFTTALLRVVCHVLAPFQLTWLGAEMTVGAPWFSSSINSENLYLSPEKMARRPGNDYSYERQRGPDRAEMLPVRFDESPIHMPEIGGHPRRGREQRHVAGLPSPRGTTFDEDNFYNSYNDLRTARLPRRRTISPSPPPPGFAQSRPRSPSVPSLASIERRRAHEFTDPGSYMGYKPASHYIPASPVVNKERIGDEYYSGRAAARCSPYYARHTRSRSKRRSRSRSRSRHRYSRSRSSSHGRVPILNRYDVRYGGLGTRTAGIDFGLSIPESETYPFTLSRHNKDTQQTENIQDSNSRYSEKRFPTPPLQPHKALMVHRPKVDRIIQSHYTGDGFMGGMHSLELTVAAGQATSTGRLPVPLFNWIRFEDSSMDFDSFQNGILNLDGIKEGERFGISRLLERVKRRYDKTLQVSSRIKVRHMIPKLLQEPFHDEAPSAETKSRKLTWLCLPYFSLQKYASSDLQPSSHPPRTLLQIRQSMTPKERDLKQADFVNHFFELWPLRFGFTYRGNAISSKDWPRIFNQAERSKVCLELKFSSKFKMSPTGVLVAPRDSIGEFDQNERQDSEEDGASNQADSNIADLDTPKSDPYAKDSNSPSARSATATKPRLSNEFHTFIWMNTHIDMSNSPKTARNSSSSNPIASINENLLQDDLQEIDDYLLQKTNFNERLTYKSSSGHTRRQFYDLLVEVESKVQAVQSLRSTYELQVELANAAEVLFGFFLSPQHSNPTTQKYWGPLYDIIMAMLPYGLIEKDVPSESENSNPAPHMFSNRAWGIDMRDVRQIVEWLETIGKRTELFKELLSDVPIVERGDINISDKLPRAWLHLLMALACVKDMSPLLNTHMNLCLELTNEGMSETIKTLSKYRLSDYVVFAPFDVASLITFQLSQDLTGPCPDICETYMVYMRSLEFDIEADPINREHQGRITDLKQEISVILDTLEIQREVLYDAQNAQLRPKLQDGKVNRVVPKYEYKPSTFAEPRATNPMNYEPPVYYRDNYEFDLNIKTPSPLVDQSSPNNPRGVNGLLFRESLALIEERIGVFRDINERATYLENWNLRSIDANKDRQETAVYAFTIVTIIFLPLSTVASILGMNTNDVRNMDLTQWLFWVIAIPLTAIIIGLVLIWSDEWYNFWSGFSNLWKNKTKRRYVRRPEDYTRVEPMTTLSMAPAARASGVYPGYYPPPPGPVPRLRKSRTMFEGGDYVSRGY